MSHILNNAFESAFAVHGFLERNARDSDFFGALNSRISSALILKAIQSLGRTSLDAEYNSTVSGSETCVLRFRFSKAIEKLSEFKNRSIPALGVPSKTQGVSLRSGEIPFDPASFPKGAVKHIGSPHRRSEPKAPQMPPRLSCAWTFFDSPGFGRSALKPNSRSRITLQENSQNPSSCVHWHSQLASRVNCQPSQKKFRIPDVQEKRVRHEGQGGHWRPACGDTDFHFKRVHPLSPPSHHFSQMVSGFPNLPPEFSEMRSRNLSPS